MPVLAADARIGRDANGSSLHAERVSWLDENGVRNPEERELVHALLDVVDAERALAAEEYREELQRESRSRR